MTHTPTLDTKLTAVIAPRAKPSQLSLVIIKSGLSSKLL